MIVDRDEQFRFFARGLFLHRRVCEVQSTARVTEVPRLSHQEINIAFIEVPEDDTPVIQMLRWLRHGEDSPAPEMPVILLVKTLDKTQLARVTAFGIHGILQKPVSGEKLLKAVVGVATNPRLFKSAGEPVADAASKVLPAAKVAVEESAPASVPVGEAPPPPPVERRTAAQKAVRVAARPVGRDLPSPPPAMTVRSGGGIGAVEPPAKSNRGTDPIEVVASPPVAEIRPWPDESAAVGKAPSEPLELAALAENKKKKKKDIALADPLQDKDGAKKDAGAGIEAILEAHASWVASSGGDGRRANLEGRELCGLALGGKVLSSAMLRRAELSGSDFTGADMHGVDLRNADVFGGTFVGTNLAVARMRHAKLRGCVFSQASLKGADLGGADLTGATFGDADLTGAILVGANLAEADLSEVGGLIQGQLDGVKGDAATRLPPGLILPEGND
ncbi:hypothetical protein CWS72_01275 [Telmatospirillum siberiense]|uniref:Response regulatory domain-containing protein n=1 Tax=Telmatospirillum siberiense TaxID=382514 RepID=A0A2N3Q1H4_9PROT|nr:hypothetical protein CWS72_01275 [Telmatospirillum siberiense]